MSTPSSVTPEDQNMLEIQTTIGWHAGTSWLAIFWKGGRIPELCSRSYLHKVQWLNLRGVREIYRYNSWRSTSDQHHLFCSGIASLWGSRATMPANFHNTRHQWLSIHGFVAMVHPRRWSSFRASVGSRLCERFNESFRLWKT
jgi:hypothetical protein